MLAKSSSTPFGDRTTGGDWREPSGSVARVATHHWSKLAGGEISSTRGCGIPEMAKARADSRVLVRYEPWYDGALTPSHTGANSTSRATFPGCSAANDAVVVVPQDQPMSVSCVTPRRFRMKSTAAEMSRTASREPANGALAPGGCDIAEGR